MFHFFQGEFSTAVPLFEESLNIYELNLGKTHPIVTSTICNLKIAKIRFNNVIILQTLILIKLKRCNGNVYLGIEPVGIIEANESSKIT